MTERLATNAGCRYALAPHPGPIHDTLYRIQLNFEEPCGRLWSSGTEFMARNTESAKALAEDLNSRLELDNAAWTAFAGRVFAGKRIRSGSGE